MATWDFKKRLKTAFAWERVICRVIASWTAFAMVNLVRNGKFYELEYAQSTPFWLIALITAAFFAVYSAVGIIFPTVETDSWALMLGATVCVCRWLLGYTVTKNKFLFLLAVIVVYTLFVIYFARKNDAIFSKLKIGDRPLMVLVAIAGLASCSVVAISTCLRYLIFHSPNFDFGLFVNMFHHMKETGLPLVTSERDVLLSHFAVHISPIYYLILPFYCIFPSPLTLQISQAVIVASGIIPAVLICKQMKLSGRTTLIVALIYALYPALSLGSFYDLHENCFLAPLLLWTFYFFEREKYPLMYLFAFLTLMVKEDAAVYIILFAIFVIFSKRKILHGVILAVGAAMYFCGALAVLSWAGEHYAAVYADSSPNPAINGPMINRFDNLIFDEASGLMGAVKTALANPAYLLTQLFTESDNGWDKVVYLLQMFLPLGLIPFCVKKPSRWLLMTPILMNLLTYYKYQYDIGFQYNYGISAFLIYALILALPELKPPSKKTLLTIGVTACCCMYMFFVVPRLNGYLSMWDNNKQTYREMEAVLETIPEDASVCASSAFVAHLADRDVIYQTNYHGYEADVDYIVIDAGNENELKRVRSYLIKGYSIETEYENRIIILKKNLEE